MMMIIHVDCCAIMVKFEKASVKPLFWKMKILSFTEMLSKNIVNVSVLSFHSRAVGFASFDPCIIPYVDLADGRKNIPGASQPCGEAVSERRQKGSTFAAVRAGFH